MINNENKKMEITELSLKDIVNKSFKASEIFEKYKIDYCCGGNRILKDVIKDLAESNKIIEEIKSILNEKTYSEENYIDWDIVDLINHIVNVHHNYIRSSTPKIKEHLDKVISTHGKNYPYLFNINDIFKELSKELQNHMMKEEQILFPFMKYLSGCQKFNEKPKTGGFGTIQNPIRQMEIEHDTAKNLINQIRELSSDYNLPEDACPTFSITYEELQEFQKNLHKHIHLENNVLFEKSIELEKNLLK